VAFATRADPCAADAAARRASLYVVEAATGRLRVVAQGECGLAAVWLDDDRLAYEDGEDGVRIVDVPSGAGMKETSSQLIPQVSRIWRVSAISEVEFWGE